MSKHSLERNLILLKWYAIDSLAFMGAVFIAYEMHLIGLSLTQIMIGESIFALTVFLFEIPSGVFSDLVSRKKTLLIAETFLLSGITIYAFASGFWHVIAAQILLGIAIATESGTDSAILYDTLKSLKREDEHRKILGSFTSFMLITIAFAQMIGGFLGSVNLRLPILLCIPIPLAKIFIILFMKEPPRETSAEIVPPWQHTKSALRWIFSHRVVTFLIMASMFCALSWKIAIHMYNPYMELIKVPIVMWGVVMASFNIISAYVAQQADWIERKLGSLNSFMVIFGIQIAGFLLMAHIHIGLALLWPMTHWVMRAYSKIFFSDEINRRTQSSRRATVLSVSNFAAQLLQMLTLPFIGYIVDAWSLQTMYLLIALILAVTGTISAIGIYTKKEMLA